jgi:molecular chaperone GrpE (heat shock protein)
MRTGYWRRVWMAVTGQQEPSAPPTTSMDISEAELRSRVAALELELRERDMRIEEMKREYAALQAARDRAVAAGGQEELEKMLPKLAGPLSNLVTLAVAAKAGKTVSSADMAGLVEDVESSLAAWGFQRLGEPGATTEFDVAAHQRMSGGSVRAGTPVVVRIPGYRFRERMLLKAMVTAKEA